MAQPPLYIDKDCSHAVCKLLKSLYGLRQAAYIWYTVLCHACIELGLRPTSSDPCIFTAVWPEGRLIVATHVDDFNMAGTPQSTSRFKKGMASHFNIKIIGQTKFLLGIQVHLSNASISLSQSTYLLKFIEAERLSNATPRSLPVTGGDINAPYSLEDSSPATTTNYRRILGKVLYAMVGTRPDIAYAVGYLGRFMATPTAHHLSMLKSLLSYLSSTHHYALTYTRKEGPLTLVGYSDADWGGAEDRRSTGGFIFTLNGCPISWESKKQPTVALSSAESEYMALTQATKEAVWLRRLLSDLGHVQSTPTPIFEDNQAAIRLGRNAGEHRRTKHIDIQYHFTREKVEQGEVELTYCPSNEQLADIMTKALELDKFTSIRDAILHPY